jgi:hypothetical protein
MDREKALALTACELEAMPLSFLRLVSEAIGADLIGCETRGDVILRISERQLTWERRRAGRV